MTSTNFSKRRSAFAIMLTLLLAFIFVTICSKSSFLYPMQDWVDVNCFFTMGRGVLNGKVIYRDIFDQKGPIVYLVFALCAYLSPTSFIGVYILEIICMWAFLYMGYKTLRLYTSSLIPFIILFPYLAFAITTSEAFAHGGSVEELCLFIIMHSLYTMLRIVREGKISKLSFFLMGIGIGVIFWVKYTMLGFYIGAFIALGIYMLKSKRFKRLFCACLIALVGFILATIPILIYFIINNSLYDLFYTYFYCNIFIYTSSGVSFIGTLWAIILGILGAIFRNLSYGALVIIGIFLVCRKKNGETALVVSAFSSMLLFLYIGGTHFYYYALPVAVFAVYGICILAVELPKAVSFEAPKVFFGVMSVFITFILAFGAYTCNKNAYLMHFERDDMPQYRFAKQINEVENATMINYGWVDMGMYFSSGILPSEKYFCTLNAPIKEMHDEMWECIDEGRVDFVVASHPIEDKFKNDFKYTLIDEASFYFEGYIYNYYLYKHNSLID